MNNILTPSTEQTDSILWALELALDDQRHYLNVGNPKLDYDGEWPEVAATKAEQFCNLASICEQLGCSHMATACRGLATAFLESAAC
jgi:hypothetical protein